MNKHQLAARHRPRSISQSSIAAEGGSAMGNIPGKIKVEPRQRAVVRFAGLGMWRAKCWAAGFLVGGARMPDGRYL